MVNDENPNERGKYRNDLIPGDLFMQIEMSYDCHYNGHGSEYAISYSHRHVLNRSPLSLNAKIPHQRPHDNKYPELLGHIKWLNPIIPAESII